MMRFSRTSAFIVAVVLWSQWDTGHSTLDTTNEKGLTLRILHTSDMHSRFEEISALTTTCSPEDSAAKKCYGGFGRIATLVREARNSTTPALFLDAGDTFHGSTWYDVYKSKIVTKFVNLLSPDAISLGSYEFDDDGNDLVSFINGVSYTSVLTANLANTELKNSAWNLRRCIYFRPNGTKVGVIGFLSPEEGMQSSFGNDGFQDTLDSVRFEAAILQNSGVNILIAIGHASFAVHKKIAAEVPNLDIVIAGSNNRFIKSGRDPDPKVPEGRHFTEIVQQSGRKVYIVQGYPYTKYLGDLSVDFDREGEVTRISSNPILVDGSIEQAEDVLEELEKWRSGIDAAIRTEVGLTKVLLDGEGKRCRRQECNLGNLITDAMIDYNAKKYENSEGWTDAAIAFHTAGSIRSSIKKAADEKITMGDILDVLPFYNGMVKINMTGSKLLEVLEWGVRTVTPNDTANLNSAFLQFSGVKVIYDLSKPAGSRVHSVQVRCAACEVPSFSVLEKNASYTVLTMDIVHGGGQGFTMLIDLNYTAAGVTTDRLLADYIQAKSPVSPSVEGRILYLVSDDGSEKVSSDPAATLLPSSTTEMNIIDKSAQSGCASYRPIGFVLAFLLMILRLT